ncbi:MAG: hypothetical protein AAF717_00375 [Bacteroidota bacterium]
MKQTLAIILGYLTCMDSEVITKWTNIAYSFWHKDDGQVVVSLQANGDDLDIKLKDGDGNEVTTTIQQYQEPENFPISKILNLQNTLNGKVNTEVGKGLSTEDFTTALKTKLDQLTNYVHPSNPAHSISDIDGLQAQLDTLNAALNSVNDQLSNAQRLLSWNGYRWYKSSTNLNNYPVAGEELQGRGDGRYEGGEYIVASEVLRDLPDGQATDQALDINIFESYP